MREDSGGFGQLKKTLKSGPRKIQTALSVLCVSFLGKQEQITIILMRVMIKANSQ